jgi:hypothetical protein
MPIPPPDVHRHDAALAASAACIISICFDRWRQTAVASASSGGDSYPKGKKITGDLDRNRAFGRTHPCADGMPTALIICNLFQLRYNVFLCAIF